MLITHNAARRITSMENYNDTIGNRTRDLPACSAMPRPTTLSPLTLAVTIRTIPTHRNKNFSPLLQLNCPHCLHPVVLHSTTTQNITFKEFMYISKTYYHTSVNTQHVTDGAGVALTSKVSASRNSVVNECKSTAVGCNIIIFT